MTSGKFSTSRRTPPGATPSKDDAAGSPAAAAPAPASGAPSGASALQRARAAAGDARRDAAPPAPATETPVDGAGTQPPAKARRQQGAQQRPGTGPRRQRQGDDSTASEPGKRQGNGQQKAGGKGGGAGKGAGKGKGKGVGKAGKGQKPAGAPKVRVIQRTAPRARPQRRHWGILLSFILVVVLPTLTGAWYMYTRASDQYASFVAFSVVKDEFSSPLEMIGGVADIASSGTSDADILNEFIQSQELVEVLDNRLDLRAIYSRPENDPLFALKKDASTEELHDYWSRMLQVIYDPGTQLINLRALAFTSEEAHAIATAVLDESTRLVLELSTIAQEDSTAFAREELDRAVERLKQAREAITRFRSRTQIVDPSADLQGQMGLLNTLQQQLAAALIEADLLRESTREGDIRLQQADRRISVIEARIEDERRKLGVGGGEGDGSEDYATLLSEFERLAVDREFAEQAYTGALAAFDTAQAEARRKSRYLFAHIKPTTAVSSQFPQRDMLTGLLALFLLAGWGIGVLIYYSVRDRR